VLFLPKIYGIKTGSINYFFDVSYTIYPRQVVAEEYRYDSETLSLSRDSSKDAASAFDSTGTM
jgi:hypothetical protein